MDISNIFQYIEKTAAAESLKTRARALNARLDANGEKSPGVSFATPQDIAEGVEILKAAYMELDEQVVNIYKELQASEDARKALNARVLGRGTNGVRCYADTPAGREEARRLNGGAL